MNPNPQRPAICLAILVTILTVGASTRNLAASIRDVESFGDDGGYVIDDCACQVDGCCGNSTNSDPCQRWCSPNWWGRMDYLMWWTSGNDVPALVTTSIDGTAPAIAGVLGQPNTTVLHGGNGIDSNARTGLRGTFGYWFDPCQSLGLEATWLSLGDGANTGNYYASSIGSPLSPILARPFSDIVAGRQNSHLVAYPDFIEGDVHVATSSEMHSASVLLRRSLHRCPAHRIDLVGGYRYLRYREGLTIVEHLNSTSLTGTVAVGTLFDIADSFATENNFHGGELGISTRFDHNCWALDMLAKVALGDIRQEVRIDGATVIRAPTQTPVNHAGGRLALPTNTGTYSQHDFGVIPELNVNLRYAFDEHLDLMVGYSVFWITEVARTGDQIDTGINPTQLPSNGGNLTGPARPAPLLGDTTMWVQGLNLGLVWEY